MFHSVYEQPTKYKSMNMLAMQFEKENNALKAEILKLDEKNKMLLVENDRLISENIFMKTALNEINDVQNKLKDSLSSIKAKALVWTSQHTTTLSLTDTKCQ